MNDIVVHKFGGSCLRDGNDIDKLLKLSVVQKGDQSLSYPHFGE